MSPADLAAMIRMADMVLGIIENFGVSKSKFDAMREQNADGHLTDEQISALAKQAHDSVARLG